MANITVNGISLNGCSSVRISDNKIIVDGVDVSDRVTLLEPKLEIRIVEGTLDSLTADGNVTAGSVKGSVSAGGNIRCDCVGGSINAGGNVNCGRVQGGINAGGNVRHA